MTTKTSITILSILLALIFFVSGATKLAGMEVQVQGFERWDYPIWFMYVTGLMEVLGAILILAPATQFVGSVALVCIMIGATGTHVMNGEIGMAGVPALLAAALAWIVWKTREPRIEPHRKVIPTDEESGQSNKKATA